VAPEVIRGGIPGSIIWRETFTVVRSVEVLIPNLQNPTVINLAEDNDATKQAMIIH
jgi:hypothetical protein